MYMYMFGICANCILGYLAMRTTPPTGVTVERGGLQFTEGLSPLVCLIIVTQAINGLLFAAVMKYANNLVRLLIIGASMIVSTSLACRILGLQITGVFAASAAVVCLALGLYTFSDDVERCLPTGTTRNGSLLPRLCPQPSRTTKQCTDADIDATEVLRRQRDHGHSTRTPNRTWGVTHAV
jgi:hypothetical protein